ncbi:DUF262 domain-containing protein [Mycobacterium marinum]|uniref:DUF262 domain-containing protein n=1 Tax=Mycobacterium marinum TaxID=1781 RepID=UPI000402EE65|nr:DUF262 domain-containing protein [Mycobacterium marinum]
MSSLQSQLDEHRQKVDVDQFDISVRELLRMVSESELSIAPEYQRQFRWDETRESELVESIFLGFPVPPLFVATNPDATWELVDGLQRVSTLVHFAGKPKDVELHLDKTGPLSLTSLQKLNHFNGAVYTELPTPLQLTFMKRTLRVTALSDKSQLEVRFDLFERLNRGGVVLTSQEVRACIYRGSLNEMLQSAAGNVKFRSLVKLQRGHASDGTREEQVLKFLAYLEDRKNFTGNVTKFLNDFMEAHREVSAISSWHELFETVIEALFGIFGGPALRKGYGNTPLNQFEALMVAAAEIIRSGHDVHGDPHIIMSDPVLVTNSTKGTNTKTALDRRIKRAKELLGG